MQNEFEIRWKVDDDGDHECQYRTEGSEWKHWGIVCPHHGPGKFKTSANWGDYSGWYRTLNEAKAALEDQLRSHLDEPENRPNPISADEMVAKMRSTPDWE